MQLMASAGVYDETRDTIDAKFVALIRNPPNGFEILEGNAGLGADWPAGVWKSATALALALSVFAAPTTIEENWPKWKAIYEKAKEFMLEFHGEYIIDRDSAQLLAMRHAVTVEGMNAAKLNIHLAIRHFYQNYGDYEDLLKSERVDMWWPEFADHGTEKFSRGVRSNEEAAKQIRSRYIFGIDDLQAARTIVVESDGTISLSKLIDCSIRFI